MRYELKYTVHSTGDSITLIEFSPNGRFLAIGDADHSLYVLDKLAGYYPTMFAVAPAKPTALVWETTKTFYVGLSNGCFIHYRIDLKDKALVEGPTNNRRKGTLPITAIALDAKSKTMVLSLGPEVYAFRRIRSTSTFRLLRNRTPNSPHAR